MQIIQTIDGELNPTYAGGDSSLIFRAKPQETTGSLPSDLSRHVFQRFTYNKAAYGIKTIFLTDYQEHLVYSVEELSANPAEFRTVRNVLSNPEFIHLIQKNVWPKEEATIKLDVLSVEETDLTDLVIKAIAKSKFTAVSDSARHVITSILGVALESAGIVKIKLKSFTTQAEPSLFPSWERIRTDAIKMLAWEHFKKIDVRKGIQGKSVGRVALTPLVHMFDDITQIIDRLINDRQQFDALAAAGLCRVLRRGEQMGDYRGITDESEVIEFAENATYMMGYLEYLDKSKIAIDDNFLLTEIMKLPIISFSRRIAGAASTIRDIEHYRSAPLDTMLKNTSLHHMLDHIGGLSGVLISPTFHIAKPNFMVSEVLHNTLGRNVFAQTTLEDEINAVMAPINDVFSKFPDQVRFIMENITEQYNSSVALNVGASSVIDVANGTEAGDVIYPLCVGLGLSDIYLQMLALALSSTVNISSTALRSGESEHGYTITYVFDVHQPDVHKVLPMISEGVSFTSDEATVIAFGSHSSGIRGQWDLEAQNIEPNARSMRYIGAMPTQSGSIVNIFGDALNYFERPWTIDLSLPIANGEQKDFQITINLYDLITKTEYIQGNPRDHIFVHFMPAVVAKMRSLISFYMILNENTPDDGSIITVRDRILVMLVDSFAQIIKTPRFKSFISQIRSEALKIMLSQSNDRVLNNYVRRRLTTGELDVDISSALLLNLLRKTHLITNDQLTTLSEVTQTKRFRQSMLTVVMA